ncbi:MAG: alpha/beta fold hydrolase [Gemmatimonadales bacterium]
MAETSAETNFSERSLDVAGLKVRAIEHGSGQPVVVLHHSTGSPGWTPFLEALATSHAVTAPDMPGYGQSERPEWARDPRDIALLLQFALDQVGLRDDVTLVGLGFGGYVAAELATMNQRRLRALVLVGAAGVQPNEGEIFDQMLVDFEDYVKAGFSSDDAYHQVFGEAASAEIKQLWDFSREMTARLAWKPYMFNRRLHHLLREVHTPTLLVWGSRDVIVPIGAANVFAAALPNARLEIVEGAGHLVELERAGDVARLIADHVRAN